MSWSFKEDQRVLGIPRPGYCKLPSFLSPRDNLTRENKAKLSKKVCGEQTGMLQDTGSPTLF